jgi:hypothetical protein
MNMWQFEKDLQEHIEDDIRSGVFSTLGGSPHEMAVGEMKQCAACKQMKMLVEMKKKQNMRAFPNVTR